MTPQSLPHVVDEAIKAAYEHKGVAIVTIPVDLGFEEIDEQPFSTAHTHKTSVILPEEKDLLAALPYLEKAKTSSLCWSRNAKRISANQRILRTFFSSCCRFRSSKRNYS